MLFSSLPVVVLAFESVTVEDGTVVVVMIIVANVKVGPDLDVDVLVVEGVDVLVVEVVDVLVEVVDVLIVEVVDVLVDVVVVEVVDVLAVEVVDVLDDVVVVEVVDVLVVEVVDVDIKIVELEAIFRFSVIFDVVVEDEEEEVVLVDSDFDDVVETLDENFDSEIFMVCVVSASKFMISFGIGSFPPLIFNDLQDLVIQLVLAAIFIPPDCCPIVQNLLLSVELQMQSHGLTQCPS